MSSRPLIVATCIAAILTVSAAGQRLAPSISQAELHDYMRWLHLPQEHRVLAERWLEGAELPAEMYRSLEDTIPGPMICIN